MVWVFAFRSLNLEWQSQEVALALGKIAPEDVDPNAWPAAQAAFAVAEEVAVDVELRAALLLQRELDDCALVELRQLRKLGRHLHRRRLCGDEALDDGELI